MQRRVHERVIDRRRLVLLDALLHDDAARRFSDTATLCFHELYAVLFRAELLVSYVTSVRRAWALLRLAWFKTDFFC